MMEQTEKQFSDSVVEYARLRGWLVHRDPTWRATGADPGYPDCTFVRDGTLIFAELKLDNARSKPTAPQQAWLAALHEVEGHMDGGRLRVGIWRPSDWDRIEEVLR